VCRNNKTTITNPKDLKKELLEAIQKNGSITIQKLIAAYPAAVKEQAMDLLRGMMDEEVLILNENGRVSLLNRPT